MAPLPLDSISWIDFKKLVRDEWCKTWPPSGVDAMLKNFKQVHRSFDVNMFNTVRPSLINPSIIPSSSSPSIRTTSIQSSCTPSSSAPPSVPDIRDSNRVSILLRPPALSVPSSSTNIISTVVPILSNIHHGKLSISGYISIYVYLSNILLSCAF